MEIPQTWREGFCFFSQASRHFIFAFECSAKVAYKEEFTDAGKQCVLIGRNVFYCRSSKGKPVGTAGKRNRPRAITGSIFLPSHCFAEAPANLNVQNFQNIALTFRNAAGQTHNLHAPRHFKAALQQRHLEALCTARLPAWM